MCKKPEVGEPSVSQRQACNYPLSAARTWTRGLGVSATAKLKLFDEAGKPTDQMQSMIGRVVLNENGHYKPNNLLIQEAAAAFEPSIPR